MDYHLVHTSRPLTTGSAHIRPLQSKCHPPWGLRLLIELCAWALCQFKPWQPCFFSFLYLLIMCVACYGNGSVIGADGAAHFNVHIVGVWHHGCEKQPCHSCGCLSGLGSSYRAGWMNVDTRKSEDLYLMEFPRVSLYMKWISPSNHDPWAGKTPTGRTKHLFVVWGVLLSEICDCYH